MKFIEKSWNERPNKAEAQEAKPVAAAQPAPAAPVQQPTPAPATQVATNEEMKQGEFQPIAGFLASA